MTSILDYLMKGVEYFVEVVDYLTTNDPVERKRLEEIWGWGYSPETPQSTKKEITNICENA